MKGIFCKVISKGFDFYNKALTSGFLYVFSANIISYLVAFCGSIVYARLMRQHDFGIYAFSFNIISFFLLVNGFGAASGVLQFVSKSSEIQLKLSYLKYSFILGIGFNCMLCLAILVYALLINLPIPGSRNILLAMAFFPVGRLYVDVFQSYLRATLNNRLLARFAISSNLLLLLFNTLGILGAGLIGFVISTYISYCIIILLGNFYFKLPNILRIKALRIDKRQFIGYSLFITLGNAFAQLLFILDILILGYLVKDSAVIASYKVATIIPFALNFIPGVVSTFFYPHFTKHADDLSYVKALYRKVSRGMLIFSSISSFVLIIIAKPLLTIIFGAEYVTSVVPFQILTFGFWIVATFRTIPGNILASLGKARFAMWLNLVIVIINIILTYILVMHFGIIGAAIGVVCIYILSGIVATYVLLRLLS